MIIEAEGGAVYHRLFKMSAEAFAAYITQLSEGDFESLVMKTTKAQLLVGDIICAAWRGPLREAGEDPSDFAVEL